MHPLHRIGGWFSSYLAGGDELERPEGGAHVRDVGLELVESSRNAGLDLVGLGPRGGVGGDLVKGLLRHDGRLRYRCPVEGIKSQASSRFEGLFLKVRGGLGQAAKARWAAAAGAEEKVPQASRPTSVRPLHLGAPSPTTIFGMLHPPIVLSDGTRGHAGAVGLSTLQFFLLKYDHFSKV